jgi:tetratricopeptide (TPR) repeat protein
VEPASLKSLEETIAANPDDLTAVEQFVQELAGKEPKRVMRLLLGVGYAHRNSVGPPFGMVLLGMLTGNQQIVEQSAPEVFRRCANHEATIALLGEDAQEFITRGLTFCRLDEQLNPLARRLAVGDFTGIQDVLWSIIVRHPEYRRAQRMYLRACEGLRDGTAARRLLAHLEGNASAGPLLLEAAKALLAADDPREAMEMALRSLVELPRRVEAAHFICTVVERHWVLHGQLLEQIDRLAEQAADASGLYELKALVSRLSPPAPKVVSAPGHVLLEQARRTAQTGRNYEATRLYLRWACEVATWDAFMEAAQACLRLGAAGRAEFLYNHALSVRPGDPAASRGLEEAKALREGAGHPVDGHVAGSPDNAGIGSEREQVKPFRDLGELKLKAGEHDAALGFLARWAEGTGTAAAFVEAGQIFERYGQLAPAFQLYERALVIDSTYELAQEMIRRLRTGTGPAASIDFEEIAQALSVSAVDQAVRIAREGLAETDSIEALVKLVRCFRDFGADVEAVVADVEGPAATAVRWLLGKETLNAVVTAGLDAEAARRAAGKLAILEERYEDALSLLEPGEDLRAFSCFRTGETDAALAEIPPMEAIISRVFEDLPAPEPRRIPATVSQIVIEHCTRAWEEYRAGALDEAAFHYHLAGQSRLKGSEIAKLNEAVVRMRQGDWDRGLRNLLPVRAMLKRDVGVLNAAAYGAIRQEFWPDAEAALRDILQINADNRVARLTLAAVLARRGDLSGAEAVLRASNSTVLEPSWSHLQIRCASVVNEEALELAFQRLARACDVAVLDPPAAGATAILEPGRIYSARILRDWTRQKVAAGEIAVAARFLNDYVHQRPNFVPAQLLLWWVKARQGAMQQAIHELEAIASRSPPDLAGLPYQYIAEILFDAGQLKEAHDVMQRHVVGPRLTDSQAHALARRIDEAMRQPNAPVEEPALEPSGQSDPARAPDTDSRAGRHATAGTAWPPLSLPEKLDFRRLKTIHSAVLEALAEGDDEWAVSTVEQVAGRYPYYVPAMLLKATVLERVGRAEAALATYRAALERCRPGGHREPVENGVRLAESLGRITDATAMLEFVLARDKKATGWIQSIAERLAGSETASVDARLFLVRLLAARGLTDEARRWVAFVYSYAPMDPKVLEAVKLLNPELLEQKLPDIGRLRTQWQRLARSGSQLRALELVESHRMRHPEDPQLLHLYVEAQVAAGKLAEALSLMTAEVERQGRREDRMLAAKLQVMNGQDGEAIETYCKIIESDPFDADVYRELRALEQSGLLPCPCDDEDLLRVCSRCLRRGNPRDRTEVVDRLVRLGPGPVTDGIIAIFTQREPNVTAWADAVRRVRESVSAEPPERAPKLARSSPKASLRKPAPLAKPAATALASFIGDRPKRISIFLARGRPVDELLRELCPRTYASIAASVDGLQQLRRGPSETLAREFQTRLAADSTLEAAVGDEAGVRNVVETLWLLRLTSHSRRSRTTDDALLTQAETRFLPWAFRVAASHEPALSVPLIEEIAGVWRALWWPDPQTRDVLKRLEKYARALADVGRTADLRQRGTMVGNAASLRERIRDSIEERPAWVLSESVGALLAIWEDLLNRSAGEQREVAQLEIKPPSLGLDDQGGLPYVEVSIRNVGHALARGTTIGLNAAPPIRLEPETPTGTGGFTIPPGAELLFRWRVHGMTESVRGLQLSGRAVCHASDSNPALIDAEDIECVCATPSGTIAEVEGIMNPYQAGKPVLPTEPSFVNRKRLLVQIRGALGTGRSGNVILLHGLRRMGKSSIAKQLLEDHASNDHPVFLSFQAKDLAGQTGDLLEWIAAGIAAGARDVFAYQSPPAQYWREDPSRCFSEFREQLKANIDERRIIVILDEFDVLLEMIERAMIDPGILGVLRDVMQHDSHLGFVVVGTNRVLDAIGRYSAHMFALMTPFKVGFLEREEASALIRNPAQGLLTFDDQAINKIIEETGGCAYFIQLLCFDLVNKVVYWDHRNHVTVLDVKIAVQRHLRQAAASEAYVDLVNRSITKLDRLLLAVIAEETVANATCEGKEVTDRLQELGGQVQESTVFSRVARLQQLDLAVIERRTLDYEYRISMPLLAGWLRRYLPASVAAEEVDFGDGHDQSIEEI